MAGRQRRQVTPHHTTGPFFPSQFIAPDDHDLTRGPNGGPAAGERIELIGSVVDGWGRPAVNIILELWQADSRGVFHDPADPRYPDRDPGFRGWGRTWTDAAGAYRFVTVRPGAYPSGSDPAWIRPPHCRFTVLGSGIMRPLVLELFFPGEPLNERDRVWLAIDPARRERVLAVPVERDLAGHAVYRLDIVLQGSRETPFLTGELDS